MRTALQARLSRKPRRDRTAPLPADRRAGWQTHASPSERTQKASVRPPQMVQV